MCGLIEFYHDILRDVRIAAWTRGAIGGSVPRPLGAYRDVIEVSPILAGRSTVPWHSAPYSRIGNPSRSRPLQAVEGLAERLVFDKEPGRFDRLATTCTRRERRASAPGDEQGRRNNFLPMTNTVGVQFTQQPPVDLANSLRKRLLRGHGNITRLLARGRRRLAPDVLTLVLDQDAS